MPISAARLPSRSASGSARQRDARSFHPHRSEAFQASPDLIEAAARDLQGIVVARSRTTALLPPLLNFKGYVALQAWRVSNWLWQRDRTDLALLLQSASSEQLRSASIPRRRSERRCFSITPPASSSARFVVIGDEVTIYQNVTIGRKQADPAAPRIGRGVLLSAGATILGDVSVGDFAKIGAGAVVDP